MRLIPLDTEKMREHWKLVLLVLVIVAFATLVYIRVIKHNEIFEHLSGCIVYNDDKSEWTNTAETKSCDKAEEIKALRKSRRNSFIPPM